MFSSLLFSLLILFSGAANAKTVHYELHIAPLAVNLSGKETVSQALAVNGSIPAPTLEFTEGDEAEVVVYNDLPGGETSIHWHGILLPNLEDGVPYVSTPPLFAGRSRAFRFPIRQHGTYWYHSHTMVQEQEGVYGAIVIHPKKESIRADREAVALLSDWSDEGGERILRNLRKDGDYYLYKKGSVRSYFGAIRAGGLGAQLRNEWQRMGGMDLSDVGYDAFLVNGKRETNLVAAQAGETVRIRLINGGSSTYFYVSLANLPFTVVAADGQEIRPVHTRVLLTGMAETYDILFRVPENKSYELRATSQDGLGWSSAWIGSGERVAAATRPAPPLYASMDHSAHAGHAGHAGMDHAHMDHSMMNHADLVTVDDLEAPGSTEFPADAPQHELKLALGGDMSRYIWYINGKAIHQDRNLVIQAGERVRITFANETMMHHPMHLHGHFFRVLNRFGARSPLKHTVDVPPHGTRVIEFLATEPGEWMLHCHNLYHMDSGMGRVVKYLSFVKSPEAAQHEGHDMHASDPIYGNALLEGATIHGKADLQLRRTWDALELRGEVREELNKHWEGEGELLYRRWLSNYFHLVAGGTSFSSEQRAVLGAGYTLPMMVEVMGLIDHEGKLRADLHRRFQWTSSIFTDAEWTFRQDKKTEFELNLMYGPSWHWAAGLMLTEERFGAGALVRF